MFNKLVRQAEFQCIIFNEMRSSMLIHERHSASRKWRRLSVCSYEVGLNVLNCIKHTRRRFSHFMIQC